MYLSAQKVCDPQGTEGVNVFVYTHRGGECQGVDWILPDVGYIADHCPGRLAAAVRSVTTKHASVLAFLDVAVAEDVSAQAVASLLDSAAARWPGSGWPMIWHAGPLGLRFYAVRALRHPGRAQAEFQALKDALLSVLGFVVSEQRGATPFPVRSPGPLIVERRPTPVGFRFELSPEAIDLLAGAGLRPAARSVSVSTETLEVFEHYTGRRVEPEVVQTLSGLPLDRVDALAGAIVVDVNTGTPIWRSPGPPA